MTIKRKLAIAILDSSKIDEVNEIIIKKANITVQSSSHLLFDTLPIDLTDIDYDITFFQLEAKDKNELDIKLKDLIENLDQLNMDYGLRDEKSGEMIVYVKFVGALDIKFDDIEIIKKDTYKKIDALKAFKSELGTCKGYKPDFRPLEEHPIKDMNVKKESIYLFCHSHENLMKLKDLLIENTLKIDAKLKTDFRIFTEADLY